MTWYELLPRPVVAGIGTTVLSVFITQCESDLEGKTILICPAHCFEGIFVILSYGLLYENAIEAVVDVINMWAFVSSLRFSLSLTSLLPFHTVHAASLMTQLLIKSDRTVYGCVNLRKMHVFAYKAHIFLLWVCVLSIWISYAPDVILFVWSIHHKQSSVLVLRTQSNVSSSAMNKWRCFKIRNIHMWWWQCQCSCYVMLHIHANDHLHPLTPLKYCTEAHYRSIPSVCNSIDHLWALQSQFFSHSFCNPVVSQWPQGPLFKFMCAYIWLDILMEFFHFFSFFFAKHFNGFGWSLARKRRSIVEAPSTRISQCQRQASAKSMSRSYSV